MRASVGNDKLAIGAQGDAPRAAKLALSLTPASKGMDTSPIGLEDLDPSRLLNHGYVTLCVNGNVPRELKLANLTPLIAHGMKEVTVGIKHLDAMIVLVRHKDSPREMIHRNTHRPVKLTLLGTPPSKLVVERAIGIENLYSMILFVCHDDSPRFMIDGDPGRMIESPFSRPLSTEFV